jgi:hypothetical protein
VPNLEKMDNLFRHYGVHIYRSVGKDRTTTYLGAKIRKYSNKLPEGAPKIKIISQWHFVTVLLTPGATV